MKRVRRPTLIASSEPFTSQNANASAAEMPIYRGISRAGSFRASSAAASVCEGRWAKSPAMMVSAMAWATVISAMPTGP